MKFSYTYLSKVYDSLMYDVDYAIWAGYIDEFLKEYSAVKIAEAACGTGSITVELAKKGYNIIASDISPDMLSIAEEKLKEAKIKARLVCQNMTKLSVGARVDAVISAMDGVNYLTLDEAQCFFNAAYTALKPGGILIFDISSKHKLKDIIASNLFFDDGDDVTYIWQNNQNEYNNSVNMDITLFIKDGEKYKRFDESHVQYAHDTNTLCDMLKDSGFLNVRAYGFLTRKDANKFDERIQFVASKLK